MADASYTAAQIRALPGAVVRQVNLGGSSVSYAPGDSVYMHSDGKVQKTDADASATGQFAGLLMPSTEKSTYVSGEDVTLCIFGPVSGFSGLTPGKIYWISATTGKLADAAGTVKHAAGFALAADILFLLPGMAAPTS